MVGRATSEVEAEIKMVVVTGSFVEGLALAGFAEGEGVGEGKVADLIVVSITSAVAVGVTPAVITPVPVER